MRVHVWDVPIRLFHWLLALSVVGAFVSGLTHHWFTAHIYFGELALCLVLFRLGWGFWGSYYARFESFIRGPQAFWAYFSRLIRFAPPRVLEHNPVASWVFLTMMLGVFLSGITGLISLGGQEQIGYLADKITLVQGTQAAEVHYWIVYGLLGLVGLHLFGATFDSILHKEFLITALWHGHKEAPEDYQPPKQRGRRPGAAVFFGISLVATAAFIALWPLEFHNAETLAALEGNKDEAFEMYQEECGGCHFAFSGNLLPKRSWDKMLAGLEDHFGEDATLEEEDLALVAQHLGAGAEGSAGEVAYYLSRPIGSDESPLEISKLPYWEEMHHEIEDAVYKQENIEGKLNCGACHQHALYGSFENAHIRVPEPGENVAE